MSSPGITFVCYEVQIVQARPGSYETTPYVMFSEVLGQDRASTGGAEQGQRNGQKQARGTRKRAPHFEM